MNPLLQALLLSFNTEESKGPADALPALTEAVDTAERSQYSQARRPVSSIPPVSPPPSPNQVL